MHVQKVPGFEQIGAADTWADLRERFAVFLDEIARKAGDEDPFVQVGMISSAYRLLLTRVVDLLVSRNYVGMVRPELISLLSLGGEARHEVTLRFDQDSAAILRAESAPYLDFLGEVVDRLAWMGVRRCQGGVMASEPGWRGSEARWRERLHFLLRGEVTREDVRASTILLDMDLLYGDQGMFEEFRSTLRDGFKDATTLQRYLADDLLSIPTYLDVFGRPALERRADRRGLFNFKFACLYPLTGYLRIESWRNGITVAASRARIQALDEAGRLTSREADGLERLLRTMIGLRLTQQRRQLERGLALSDFFRLDLFTKQERKALSRCVRRVEALKKRVRWLYWL